MSSGRRRQLDLRVAAERAEPGARRVDQDGVEGGVERRPARVAPARATHGATPSRARLARERVRARRDCGRAPTIDRPAPSALRDRERLPARRGARVEHARVGRRRRRAAPRAATPRPGTRSGPRARRAGRAGVAARASTTSAPSAHVARRRVATPAAASVGRSASRVVRTAVRRAARPGPRCVVRFEQRRRPRPRRARAPSARRASADATTRRRVARSDRLPLGQRQARPSARGRAAQDGVHEPAAPAAPPASRTLASTAA